MIKFITNYLKRQKEIKLAGLKAQLRSEYEIGQSFGEIYPIIISELVRQIAELEETLRNV